MDPLVSSGTKSLRRKFLEQPAKEPPRKKNTMKTMKRPTCQSAGAKKGIKAAATSESLETAEKITVSSFRNPTFSTTRIAGICAVCAIGAKLARRPITKSLAPSASSLPGRRAPVTSRTMEWEVRAFPGGNLEPLLCVFLRQFCCRGCTMPYPNPRRKGTRPAESLQLGFRGDSFKSCFPLRHPGPGQQSPGRLKPCRSVRFVAAIIQNKSGNPLDALRTRNARQLLRIHLRKDGPAGCLRRRFRKFGSHHLAGTAPLRPEIDDHGQWGLSNEVRENLLRRHLHWQRGEWQPGFASAATPALTEAGEGDAIGGVAGGAGLNNSAGVGSKRRCHSLQGCTFRVQTSRTLRPKYSFQHQPLIPPSQACLSSPDEFALAPGSENAMQGQESREKFAKTGSLPKIVSSCSAFYPAPIRQFPMASRRVWRRKTKTGSCSPLHEKHRHRTGRRGSEGTRSRARD